MMRAVLRRSTFTAIALATLGIVGCKSTDPASARGGERVSNVVSIEDTKPVVPGASVHVAAGDLAVSQQNLAEAAKQYRKAIEMNPKDDVAMFKLATVYAYARQFDDAISMWQRYNATTGDTAAGYSNLGRTYELAGRWREAEASYVQAIRRDPSNATARVNYGIMLAKRDRTDEAELQLGKALPPAEVQYNLGSVSELRQDLPSARSRYARAFELDPTLVAAKQRLAALGGSAVTAVQ
jgi:tetratricopeptide (TPR) repeat protein